MKPQIPSQVNADPHSRGGIENISQAVRGVESTKNKPSSTSAQPAVLAAVFCAAMSVAGCGPVRDIPRIAEAVLIAGAALVFWLLFAAMRSTIREEEEARVADEEIIRRLRNEADAKRGIAE